MVGGGVGSWRWTGEIGITPPGREPKPRGSRSPEVRAGPVIIPELSFWLLPLPSLGWSHSTVTGRIQKPLPSGPLVLWVEGNPRLPNHVGLQELQPQIPGSGHPDGSGILGLSGKPWRGWGTMGPLLACYGGEGLWTE